MKNSRHSEIDLTEFVALVREKVRTNTQTNKTLAAQRLLSGWVRTVAPTSSLADESMEQIQQSLAELRKAINLFSSSSDVAEFVSREDRSYSINELLSYEDRSFIKVAYVAILGRLPDTEGEASYLAHLRGGMPKYQILLHVAASEEGKRYGAKLRGLAIIVGLKSWYEVPVIGRLLNFFTPAVNLNALERKISVIEGGFAGARESFLQTSIQFLDAISSVSALQAIFRNQLQAELNDLVARVEEFEALSKTPMGNNLHISGQPDDDFCRTPRANPDLEVCLKSHLLLWRAEKIQTSEQR